MISSSPRKCQENTKTKPQNGNAAKFKSHRNCDVAGEWLLFSFKRIGFIPCLIQHQNRQDIFVIVINPSPSTSAKAS